MGVGDVDHGFLRRGSQLAVFRKEVRPVQLSERIFHYPALGQEHETVQLVALHKLHSPTPELLVHRFPRRKVCRQLTPLTTAPDRLPHVGHLSQPVFPRTPFRMPPPKATVPAGPIAPLSSHWDAGFDVIPEPLPLLYIPLKTAVEVWSEWPTVSIQKGLQTLMISPFWSDAEPYKDPLNHHLAAPQSS